MSVQISSRKVAEILNFKFKHGDPFHCQAELNFKALRVFEKHKGSGEFFSFNAVVYATFFLKKFVSCLPQTGFIGLVLQSSDEEKTFMAFTANSQASMYFLACYSQNYAMF